MFATNINKHYMKFSQILDFFLSLKKYVWAKKCALCVHTWQKIFLRDTYMCKQKKFIIIISVNAILATIEFFEKVIFFFAKNRYF